MKSDLSRREFAPLLGLTGSALWFRGSGLAWAKPKPLPPAPGPLDESYWASVRSEFVLPPDLAVMNAANLCLYNSHREIERTLGAIQRWLATGV